VRNEKSHLANIRLVLLKLSVAFAPQAHRAPCSMYLVIVLAIWSFG